MRRTSFLLLALLLPAGSTFAQQFSAGGMQVSLRGGVITALTGRGAVFAQGGEPRGLCALRTLKGDLNPPAAPEVSSALSLPATLDLMGKIGGPPPALQMQLSADKASGELVIEQSGEAAAGLHGIQWGIAGIPLDYEIIVPGTSGLKFDRHSPINRFDFSYPLGWECQFVIVQGKQAGFCVWADDPTSAFKSLHLRKGRDGWDLAFESQNLAPFADKTSLRSVKWRLGLTGPNWQDAAARYRQWATANFGLTRLADQQPAWVKDTRTLVLCGLQPDLLDRLAATVDPRQTMLYVAEWRRDGYDRNYPDYTAKPGLTEFLNKAHALGFRVMLHVNYFGCDPKNELWEKFKPYHVRDPFSHEPLWWVWPFKGEPDIKFAYINPASKAWRELFVGRMKELCTKYPVDALHLDQTLCIWNDDAGRVDGLTMVEGSLAEHRELRAALPQVALSGEGLNEVTCRYEAFAQRHAFGLNHAEGSWDRARLAMAHPVSASILRPFTIINGYLGMANPENGQLYAAWQQAYTNWGVIPTFAWPNAEQLANPQGFARQLLDEIHFLQKERVDPDLSSPHFTRPDNVFPYRTALGKPVDHVRDGGWRLVDDRGATVSRTVTGVSEFASPGSLPGWLGYDDQRLFGLHKEAWYPWVSAPRDPAAFHVTHLPEGLEIARVTSADEIATVVTHDPLQALRVSDLLGDGRCGYTVFEGEGEEFGGQMSESKVGASFVAAGEDLHVHPPWKGTRKNPQTGVLEAAGTGQVYCLVRVKLPPDSHPRFVTDVYIDANAAGEGKSDGVTFSVEASAEGLPARRAELHNATATPEPFKLDLNDFAGREIALKLTVDPGPQHSATFDWARWQEPRLAFSRQVAGVARVVSPQSWKLALTSSGEVTPREITPHQYEIATTFPGAIYLLNRPLQEVALPADVTKLNFVRSYLAPQGTLLSNPQYACANVGDTTVGGVSRHGFFAHPPSQGQTRMDFPLRLPAGVRRFSCQAGLKDGSKSEGCLFIIEVTGKEIARKLMLPGKWEALTADLAPFAGRSVVLSLVTDADTTFSFDWAGWGDPRLE